MSANVDPKVLIGTCPGCNTKIRFYDHVELGEFVSCEECGDELEVVQLYPLKLDWAYSDPLEDDDQYVDADDFYFDDDDYDWGDDD